MSAVQNGLEPELRPMTDEDLDAVWEVERLAYDFPWSRGIFKDCLRVGYCCWVWEAQGRLLGHFVMSVAVGEAHLLNLCVHPQWQGQGLGRRMLHRVFRIAVEHRADTLFLEVRVSNSKAIVLYESEDLVQVGERRDYYPNGPNGREDAVVYARTLYSSLDDSNLV